MMKCTFCGKNFHFQQQQQTVYETHVMTCAVLHDQRGSVNDEPIPNQKEMFKLIQYLMHENKRLREEFNTLKHRKYLRRNTTFHAPHPNTTFSNWIKEFQVEYRHLEKVFQRDVYDGIKLCILDRIQDEKWENIPIRVHREPRHKRAQIYIFDLALGMTDDHQREVESKWIVCDNLHFNLLMNAVVLKLEIRFLEWDAQHVPETTEEKDQYHINLLKIEGSEFRRHIDQYRVDLRTVLIRNAAPM